MHNVFFFFYFLSSCDEKLSNCQTIKNVRSAKNKLLLQQQSPQKETSPVNLPPPLKAQNLNAQNLYKKHFEKNIPLHNNKTKQNKINNK